MNLKFSNQTIHISRVRLGDVVQRNEKMNSDYSDFGHIQGFSRNCFDEIMIIVKFSKRDTAVIVNPQNLHIF